MKTRVARLTGDLLDYAVALAEKYEPRCSWMLEQQGYDAWQQYEHAHGNPVPAYSTGSAGDTIIDREKIETRWCVTDGDGSGYWMAQNILTDTYGYSGATRRIAAMRCYVASKFGAEIELPRMNCTPPNEGIAP